MLARFLSLQYPDVLFHFDYGSGVKLNIGQAIKNKKLNKRAWPDLLIAEARGGHAGLFLELKREGTKLYKRDGSLRRLHGSHEPEQADTLLALRFRGYQAQFAIGYDDAVMQITDYLKLPKNS